MAQLNINKFEIADMSGMNTLAFLVEESDLVSMKGQKFYSLQKLDYIDKDEESKKIKEFNVVANNEEKSKIVLLTLTASKAILSTGVLDNTGFNTTDEQLPLSYGSIYNQDGIEYKEFAYTPDMKRSFSIIDTATREEVKPTLYVDEITSEVKGKCKLLPLRPYVVLEIKGNYNRSAVISTDGKKINSISYGKLEIGDKEIASRKRALEENDILKDGSIV